MNCAKCGKSIPGDAAFCAYCGQPVERPSTEVEDKVLLRPKAGRLIAGVAAGMAHYFGLPVIALRIIWVLVTAFSVGLGALLYVALCFAMPDENKARPTE